MVYLAPHGPADCVCTVCRCLSVAVRILCPGSGVGGVSAGQATV
jgi:hypothetical protein